MKRRLTQALALLLASAIFQTQAPAQSPPPATTMQTPAAQRPADADDDDVVRITTNLVQFDA
ncbi:MAG: hypothetical protein ABR603_13950, partial [Pyrinomonadaceae bacterium]